MHGTCQRLHYDGASVLAAWPVGVVVRVQSVKMASAAVSWNELLGMVLVKGMPSIVSVRVMPERL